MKKSTETQIIKWYEAGISVDEFAPLIPQHPKPEIEAVIERYRKGKAWARLVTSPRH
nr:MAG: hypothetical protein [Bacteriophage sp.]